MTEMLYLDMDGVLVDFIGGVCREFGMTEEELIARHSKPVPWDLEQLFGRSFAEIDARLDEGFWYRLEKYPWADELVNLVTDSFPNRVVLCTSAGKPGTNFFHHATMGKALWVRKHFPQFADSLMIVYDKSPLAAYDRILVDDSEDNLRRFVANGGSGILFPQWWNSRWYHREKGAVLDVVAGELKMLV